MYQIHARMLHKLCKGKTLWNPYLLLKAPRISEEGSRGQKAAGLYQFRTSGLLHMAAKDRSWIACTLSSLARRARFLVVATPHKRPVIERRFGVSLALKASSSWVTINFLKWGRLLSPAFFSEFDAYPNWELVLSVFVRLGAAGRTSPQASPNQTLSLVVSGWRLRASCYWGSIGSILFLRPSPYSYWKSDFVRWICHICHICLTEVPCADGPSWPHRWACLSREPTAAQSNWSTSAKTCCLSALSGYGMPWDVRPI